MKRCPDCKRNKPETAFTKCASKVDGLDTYCRACKNHRQRRNRYGLSKDEYRALLADHGRRCGICGDRCSERDSLSVDHCHESGMVRGLLCNVCNRAIGLLGDSPEKLARAMAYLNRSRVLQDLVRSV